MTDEQNPPCTRNAWDWHILARTVFGEARGEGYLGQVGVAWVAKNRAVRGGWFGTSIADVCLKPQQFSCWNDNDPNKAAISKAQIQDHGFLRALGIAALVIAGDIQDPTGGADHYHAVSIPPPSWTRRMTKTVQLGQHIFYKS